MGQTEGRNPNLRVLAFAKAALGEVEEGINSGPFIERIQREIFGIADHQAYCMAFVQFIVREVEKEFGIHSPIYHSGSVLQTWLNSQMLKVPSPEPGDIVCWRVTSATGHTGIYRKSTGPDTFLAIEGNTSKGKAGSQREGDGFWEKSRTTKSVAGWELLGFLRVFKT